MISVIVPNYNNEAYLAECLQSIVQQTYTDLQIIVVDDGSTDNSVAIMQQFAQQDPRIEVITQANAGLSAARNKGVQYVQGEFISFVDSDDYLDSDFYATLINAIGNNDIAQCSYTRIQNQRKTTKKRYIFYSLLSAWIRLYRTSFYKKNALQFDEATRYFEDIIFSWYLWELKPKYVFLSDYAGYNYRQNATSITATQKNYQPIYHFLKNQMKHATFRMKVIGLYTLLRLHCHQMLQK